MAPQVDPAQGVTVWVKCPICGGEHYAQIPNDSCMLLPCTRQAWGIFCINVDPLKCLICPGSTAELFQPGSIVREG